MPPELAAAVRDAAEGRAKAVYLIAGEPFETAAAAHALIDALVPVARRSFNLETYDGRTTAITTVIDSLRTPGFFAGTKLIWVRETTLFLSGEKRADVTSALLAAWGDGRERDAAEALVTLAALAGWSQEQFASVDWRGLAKTRLREVFGDDLDAEQVTQLEAIQGVCRARDLTVAAYRDDSGTLLEFLDGGMPPQTVLVLTASAVDARKRLFKRVREIGVCLTFEAARERSGALARQTVDDVVRRVAGAFGKRVEPAAHELIVRRAGAEMGLLSMELEKLCLYVGERPIIAEADVRAAFRDMAGAWIFDFTGAFASRQLGKALPLLQELIEQGEPPLRVLAMIAREVRMLLLARECLDDALRGKWRPDVPFNVFQSRILPLVDTATREAFGKAHPFVLYRRFQDAGRTTARVLRDALLQLSDLDLRFKTSRGDPGLLLEAFVIDWCRRRSGATAGRAVE